MKNKTNMQKFWKRFANNQQGVLTMDPNTKKRLSLISMIAFVAVITSALTGCDPEQTIKRQGVAPDSGALPGTGGNVGSGGTAATGGNSGAGGTTFMDNMCAPTESRQCATAAGNGYQVCNAARSGFDACIITQPNPSGTGGTTTAPACAIGQSIACTCSAGSGYQVCNSARTGYDSCVVTNPNPTGSGGITGTGGTTTAAHADGDFQMEGSNRVTCQYAPCVPGWKVWRNSANTYVCEAQPGNSGCGGSGGTTTSSGGVTSTGGVTSNGGTNGSTFTVDLNKTVSCQGHSFQQNWLVRFSGTQMCLSPVWWMQAGRACPYTVSLRIFNTGNGSSASSNLSNTNANITSSGFCWIFSGQTSGDYHWNAVDANYTPNWGLFGDGYLANANNLPAEIRNYIEREVGGGSYGVVGYFNGSGWSKAQIGGSY